MVKSGDRNMREEHARHAFAVPGSQVRENDGACADLKLTILLVDVDQIHGILDGDRHFTLHIFIGGAHIHDLICQCRRHDFAAILQSSTVSRLPQVEAGLGKHLWQRPTLYGF
ncbi:MAG TPA: hypothetical protein EYQ31_00300 [Candidatus Handelsmanbacteria bacterium]|nr:hypothetical protein [Candidatus Handelsmanbacteria bacterium]